MSPKKETRKSGGFTAEEQAAMKERAQELKAEARASKNRAAGESDLLAKIAEMPEPDRSMAARLHEIITESAPALWPKTWYGMPAYARDGKVVCFFQSAAKFNARYATFGFNDTANLDEGNLWATSFALKELTAAEEARIVALVRKAVNGDSSTQSPPHLVRMELGAFSISLAVKDIEASKSFYEKLGFEVFGGDISQNWLILKNGGHVIGLFQGMFEKNMLTFNPGWDSNACRLDAFTDVRELQRRLKAQGVAFQSEADESTTGPASFVVVDPDGNPILVDQHV